LEDIYLVPKLELGNEVWVNLEDILLPILFRWLQLFFSSPGVLRLGKLTDKTPFSFLLFCPLKGAKKKKGNSIHAFFPRRKTPGLEKNNAPTATRRDKPTGTKARCNIATRIAKFLAVQTGGEGGTAVPCNNSAKEN
jgi:hypothetical protein